MERFELQYINIDGDVVHSRTCDTPAELGQLLAIGLNRLRVAAVDDNGPRRALTAVERAAMVAAMEQEGVGVEGRDEGLLLTPWPPESDEDSG